MRLARWYVFPALFFFHALGALASDTLTSTTDSGMKVHFGGFVDTYYGYDFNAPSNYERIGFTTTAPRSNEFNINMAYLDAKLESQRLRGRLALQAGNSVQANYAGEPRNGSVSGPSLMQHLQEAYVGYRVVEKLWIDAGIMFSYIGLESFLSRDNWNYTRSLVADLSPYYQSGVRATYEATPDLSFQLNVMNGWQNISENNPGKAVGWQVSYQSGARLTLVYNGFLGNEAGDHLRFFNDCFVKAQLSEALELALAYDFGWQNRGTGVSTAFWHGASLLGRVRLISNLHLGTRVEFYSDPDHAIAQVSGAAGFEAVGASANIDVELLKDLLWRTELRGIWARHPVFPGRNGLNATDGLTVMSLAYSF